MVNTDECIHCLINLILFQIICLSHLSQKRKRRRNFKSYENGYSKHIVSTKETFTYELCELDNDCDHLNVKMSIITSIRLYTEISNESKNTNN